MSAGARATAAAPAAGHALSTHVVPPDCAGLRLDQALAKMLPEHSRSRLRAWIDAGDVTVDGHGVDAKRRVHGGERVDIAPAAATVPLADAAEDIALRVVHEDAAIVVVDKPAGLVVHPGSGNPRGTLLNALLHHHPALSALPRAGIVHRLDKDTSGLMVVAKTPQAHTDLVRQLAARTVRREYIAVARGDVARAAIVDAPIGRHPVQRTAMAVVAKGKPARTHVDVVERFGSATLGLLLRLWKRVRDRGGRTALCNASPRDVGMMRATCLDRVWPLCPTRQAALEAVRA